MQTIHFYSVAYNRPDFVPLQFHSLKKQWEKLAEVTTGFSFTVLINTKDEGMLENLKAVCAFENIRYYVVPFRDDEMYNGGLTAYNFIRDKLFPQAAVNDLSVIMDADMFFYAPLDIVQLMEGFDVAAIYHQREKKRFGFEIYNYEYLWVGFMIFRHGKFDWSTIDFSPIKNICDVGGMTNHFLKREIKNGLKVKWLKHTADITHEFKKIFPQQLWQYYKPDMGFQIIENTVIHYYRGSNWNGKDKTFIDEKDLFLKKFFLHSASKPHFLPKSDQFDSLSYSRKHFNGIVNNKNKKISPSIGEF